MKICRKRLSVLTLLIFNLFFNSSPEAASVEELEKRVQDLEKRPSYMPKVGGYIEGWYRSDNSDLSTQTTAAKKVGNEFRIRRARIDVKGDATDEIGYRVNANFDGPSPASSSATVKLWDGYINYKFHPLLNLTLGQFKYPFTLEGLESTADRIPVLRAESINDIAGKLGTQGGSFRDIGLLLKGSHKDSLGFNYGAAIINGKGINQGDNNNSKDIAGRITISPVNGLTIGGSAYTGKGQDEGSAFNIDESAYAGELELIIKDLGLSIRSEYINAEWKNWDAAAGTASSGKTQKPNGWYLQGAYNLPILSKLQVTARYEDYEKDSNTTNSHLKTTTVGATYYFKEKTRISVNYLIRSPDNSNIVSAQETEAVGNRIGNLLLVQMLVSY